MGIRTQRKKDKEKMKLLSILAPDHIPCEDDTYDWVETDEEYMDDMEFCAED